MLEDEVDQRVKQVLEMEPECPSTVTDLVEVLSLEKKTRYDVFWSECSKFINEDIGIAVAVGHFY